MVVLSKRVQNCDKRSINKLLKPDNTFTETIQRLPNKHIPAAHKGKSCYVHVFFIYSYVMFVRIEIQYVLYLCHPDNRLWYYWYWFSIFRA